MGNCCNAKDDMELNFGGTHGLGRMESRQKVRTNFDISTQISLNTGSTEHPKVSNSG